MQTTKNTTTLVAQAASEWPKRLSFASRESIIAEADTALARACLECYEKNILVRETDLRQDGDYVATLAVDADSLSGANRKTALKYGDEWVLEWASVIRLAFGYERDTTIEELSERAFAAARKFDAQAATWATPIDPDAIRKAARATDQDEELFRLEKGFYRDPKSGKTYRSRTLYEKSVGAPADDGTDAVLKVPGYAGLSTEAKRLLVHQWRLCDALGRLPLETVTNTRLKIGLKLLTAGTLVHGTRYEREKIRSIAGRGILAREFTSYEPKKFGRYTAEFYRVPETMGVAEYVRYYRSPEALVERADGAIPLVTDRLEAETLPSVDTDDFVAFFIDTEHGDISELLDRDAYRSSTVGIAELTHPLRYDPRSPEATKLSAVLCGIPANFIAGILLPDRIASDKAELVFLADLFPERVIFFDLRGEIVRRPVSLRGTVLSTIRGL